MNVATVYKISFLNASLSTEMGWEKVDIILDVISKWKL